MIYMSIEQIRKENDIYKRHLKDKVKNINDVDKLYKDIEYLLSIIDRYKMVYMDIEQIRKRVNTKYGAIADGITDSTIQLQASEDGKILLSIIDKYEGALKYIVEKEPHGDEVTEIARQALKPNS